LWYFTAVYSVGLYVEGSAAKKALHKYKGKDADQLLINQNVFDGESTTILTNNAFRSMSCFVSCFFEIWQEIGAGEVAQLVAS
jgi:hypothetical protein